MSKITYANKVALYENSDIADINKVKADDMNEIKTCVNNNDDMLTGGAVAGNMVVDSIRTKNMFDIKSMYGATTGGANTDISTSNNVQITSITNSSISFTTSANWNGVACDFIEVKPSNDYILSFQSSAAANQMFVKICLYDSSKTFIQDVYATGNLNFTITTTSATKYITVIIEKIDSSSSAITLSNIQLEEGSTVTSYNEYQNLNPDISGLDNTNFSTNTWGGLAKRSIRSNATTFTINDPNFQNNGYVRNAIVCCGDSGIMFIRWSGNNALTPAASWSNLTGGKTCTITQNNGILTFTFSSTVYGGVNILFMN